MIKKMRLLGLAIIFYIPGLVYSGNFEISPVRINLDAKTSTAAINLKNNGDENVVIQTELMKWEPHEVYTPTRELLVNPPIFTVKPGQSQIVRIALTKLISPENEIPYRIFFNEVPKTPKSKGVGLQMALRIGVPIFVLVQNPTTNYKWSVMQKSSGKFQVSLSNQGNTHVQILDLVLSPTANETELVAKKNIQDYVLPGETAEWLINSKSWKSESALLTVHTDRGIVKEKVQLMHE